MKPLYISKEEALPCLDVQRGEIDVIIKNLFGSIGNGPAPYDKCLALLDSATKPEHIRLVPNEPKAHCVVVQDVETLLFYHLNTQMDKVSELAQRKAGGD